MGQSTLNIGQVERLLSGLGDSDKFQAILDLLIGQFGLTGPIVNILKMVLSDDLLGIINVGRATIPEAPPKIKLTEADREGIEKAIPTYALLGDWWKEKEDKE